MAIADEPRPGTAASLDRRIERIEAQLDVQKAIVDGLVTDMAVMKVEQGHTKDLMQAEFRALGAGQNTLAAKLDVIGTSLSHKDVEAARMIADPNATAAGQAVMTLITDARNRIGAIEKRLYTAAGAVAVVIFLIQLLTPLVRALLHLP